MTFLTEQATTWPDAFLSAAAIVGVCFIVWLVTR